MNKHWITFIIGIVIACGLAYLVYLEAGPVTAAVAFAFWMSGVANNIAKSIEREAMKEDDKRLEEMLQRMNDRKASTPTAAP